MSYTPMISLKAARVNANLTQEEAAKMLGVSKTTLQNYEAGETIPDILMTRKISDVYGFPSDFIFFAKNNA